MILKSGFIGIVGRPNVGKSTLLNAILGEKIAITTDKPQTTRTNIRTIYNTDDTQIIFVDTPGVHKPDSKMNKIMVDKSFNSAIAADCVLLLADARFNKPGSVEQRLIELCRENDKKVILAINKEDEIRGDYMLPIIANYSSIYDFADIVPISAKTGKNVDTLLDVISSNLPEGPRLFDSESIHLADGKIAYDGIIPNMLATLPDLLIGIVIMLVLSASMSTLASLVLTSSSTLTLDLIKDNIIKDMDEKKQVVVMRCFLVFFIIISVVIALNPPTFIAQLMGISWGALAGAFLAPFMFSLYWKKTTKAACYVSFAFGSLLMIANMLFRAHFPAILQSPINCGSVAMLAGLVIVPLVSLVTPKPDTQLVEETFACYNRKQIVTAKESLGEDAE